MSALIYLPPVNLIATASLVQILAAPPTGFVESFNLRATIVSGAADAYASVFIAENAGPNDGYVTWNELIKYSAQGAGVDILMGYQLHPGYSVQIIGSTTGLINFQAYNRVRKKIA